MSKRHGLQGPIDDAFMSSFVFVRPTGKAMNDKVAAWSASELDRAITQWRGMFRGEAPVKTDAEISDADIAGSNLVLWGDPASNAILAKIIDRLPIGWNAQTIKVGDQTFAAANHSPVLIFPNPLNPRRYVVINSGVTFREAHYLTNAQQTPKLPDWAVVDLSVPASAYAPGRIAAAGFFGERWELKGARRNENQRSLNLLTIVFLALCVQFVAAQANQPPEKIKILIVYHSQAGHTEAMAKAVTEAKKIPQAEVTLKKSAT